ncbi:MAG: histidine kinase [Erysipelotrichales bacterium]
MFNIMQKILLIVLAIVTLSIFNSNIEIVVIVLIVSASLSAIELYLNESNLYKLIYSLIIVVLCLCDKSFIFLIPLCIYDTLIKKYYFINSIILVSILLISSYSFTIKLILLIVVCMTLVTSILVNKNNKAKEIEIKDKDEIERLLLELDNQKNQLIDAQDSKVEYAMLSERGRIAREIHDNVGHILSSSIIQVGALKTINEDQKINPLLDNLDTSLNQGMDAIRNSVHNIHAQSLNLEMELNNIIENYKFCPVKLSYNLKSNTDKKIKLNILTIVKEALNNTTKHSNATIVTMSIRELPNHYQLIINDNGNQFKENDNGIGLVSIQERIESLKGITNINNEDGFKIHITIPKEVKNNESNFNR